MEALIEAGRHAGWLAKGEWGRHADRRQTGRQKEEERGRQTGICHALVRNEEEDEGDNQERLKAMTDED